MKQLRKLICNAAIGKLRTFCKHCTLHGFYYFSEKRHPMVYATWITIIIASTSLCGFLSHMIWLKYTLDPTFTVVQTIHYSTTEIPFPAVTFCDAEQVYGPNTRDITDILKQRRFTDEQIKEFYNSFSGVKANDYEPPSYVQKMHKALHDLGHTYNIMLEMFSKPCEVLLVRCIWRSHVHNCTEMFRKLYTVTGFCCHFDMEYFMKNADPSTNFVPGVEVGEALDVTVDGQKITFDDKVTTGYVWLYVYDDSAQISIMDSPATLTPGGFFDTNINMWLIDSSNDVKKLSINERKCFITEDCIDKPKSYVECISVYVLRKVVDTCRCLPFNYSAKTLQVEDLPKCSWDRLLCVYRYLEKVKSNIKEIVNQNDCLQRCDGVHYGTDIKYVKYHNNVGIDTNFSNTVVHYSSRNCLKYRREVLYSWDQMLANLGGIFGLCLGGSIISVIEIAWFAVEFLFTFLKGVRNSRTTPREKEKSVFTLTNQDPATFNVIRKGNINKRYKFVN